MAYLQNLSRSPNSTSPPSGERGFLITHNHGETDSEPIPDQRSPAIENIHQDYQWDAQSESAYLEKHVSWLATVYDPAELKSEDKVLFPPNLQGFVLRTRKWATFDVDDIHDVTYPSGFDKLVLPPGHDKTVRALVARHAQIPSVKDTSSHIDSPSMDLVRGKGEGLVILLHGAPGTFSLMLQHGPYIRSICKRHALILDRCRQDIYRRVCGRHYETTTLSHHCMYDPNL